MQKLTNIYESWSEQQADGKEILDAWKEIATLLSEYFSYDKKEALETKIFDYCKLVEQQAFFAGYMQASSLMLEIIRKL